MASGVSVATNTSTRPFLVSIRWALAISLNSAITTTKMGTTIVPTSTASSNPPNRNRSRPKA